MSAPVTSRYSPAVIAARLSGSWPPSSGHECAGRQAFDHPARGPAGARGGAEHSRRMRTCPLRHVECATTNHRRLTRLLRDYPEVFGEPEASTTTDPGVTLSTDWRGRPGAVDLGQCGVAGVRSPFLYNRHTRGVSDACYGRDDNQRDYGRRE